MADPVRIQLRRTKGFGLQEHSRALNGLEALKVDRSTIWGNPFPIIKGTSTSAGKTSDVWQVGTWDGPAMWFCDTKDEATDLAIKAFRSWIDGGARAALRAKARVELRGKNLACWCMPGPCHADVLLELANS